MKCFLCVHGLRVLLMVELSKRDVFRSEVGRLVSEQNLPPCPYDDKPCLVPKGACSADRFGVGLPLKAIWRCSRLPVDK